jgi:hypothetical protein
MARYFFHLHNDMDAFDEEGADLPDDAAARAYAVDSVRDVAVESIVKGRLNLEHFIDIVREDGTAVHRVRFGDAICVTGQT